MSSASRSARFARAGALSLLVASLLLPRAHAEIHGAFAHGVASGDPTSESVIIWTRVTPVGRDQPDDRDPTFDDAFEVTWTVATKPPWRSPREGAGAFLPSGRSARATRRPTSAGELPFVAEDAFDFGWGEGSVEKTGVVTATAARDWTVKVDVDGLASNVRYYYAFEVGASAQSRRTRARPRRDVPARSPVGTFVLPPPSGRAVPHFFTVAVTAEVRGLLVRELGVRAFPRVRRRAQRLGRRARRVAPSRRLLLRVRRGQLSRPRGSRSRALVASLRPRNETWTLEDYRARHALYRSDDALRRLHAAAPVIAMWDDHEIANNPWTNGGENHQPEREGAYATRARGDSRVPRVVTDARTDKRRDWSDKQNGPFAYNRTVHFRGRHLVRRDGDAARGAHGPQRQPRRERLREFNNNVFAKHTPRARALGGLGARGGIAPPRLRSGRVPEPVTTRMCWAPSRRAGSRRRRARLVTRASPGKPSRRLRR